MTQPDKVQDMSKETNAKPHVVIVGGGFAGLAALNHLRHLLHKRVRITLIDKSQHTVNRPMMPEIAFEGKAAADSLIPMFKAVSGADTSLIYGSVVTVATDQNTVLLDDGLSMSYDYLILAPGPVHDYAAVAGLEQFGHSICDETHAAALWQALHDFKGGNVVIGSAPTAHGSRVAAPVLKAACEGPVGEAMFMMDRHLRHRGVRDKGSIRIFSPASIFFEDVGNEVHKHMGPLVERAGIAVTTDLVITRVDASQVEFADGTTWDSDFTIVLPPHAPPAFIAASGLSDEVGWVPTDTEMRHLDHANIFGAGDCNALSQPKLGHIAALQGEIAATTIARELDPETAALAYAPEVLCIMNRGGHEATLIASNSLYGGELDVAVSGSIPHMMKWSFDAYYGFRHGELPPDWSEKILEWGLRHL